MTRAIERLFIPGGSFPLSFHDREIPIESVEKLAGKRLDRRKSYAVIRGEVCESASWTGECSGCSTDYESCGYVIGMGCRECGYTGKRRHSIWIPLTVGETE